MDSLLKSYSLQERVSKRRQVAAWSDLLEAKGVETCGLDKAFRAIFLQLIRI